MVLLRTARLVAANAASSQSGSESPPFQIHDTSQQTPDKADSPKISAVLCLQMLLVIVDAGGTESYWVGTEIQCYDRFGDTFGTSLRDASGFMV